MMTRLCLDYFVWQSIPRAVVFDKKTGTNILQWPVAEIKSLRKSSKKFDKLEVGPGSVVTLEVEKATQVCFLFSMCGIKS